MAQRKHVYERERKRLEKERREKVYCVEPLWMTFRKRPNCETEDMFVMT